TNPEIGSNTRGLEHYATLYADSRKWLQEGWIDYLAPQVYWWIGQPGADYGIVTPWWNNQAYGRHIYIGLAGYKVNDPAQGVNWANPSQIPNEVRMNRSADHPNIYGQAVYNTSSLRSPTRLGFRDSLRNDFYRRPVLLPAMPWRDNQAPAAPADLAATRNADGTTTLTWTPPAAAGNPFDEARQFGVYRAETPTLDVAGGTHLVAVTAVGATTFTDTPPVPGATYFYKVTALDRFHNESAPSNVTDYDAPTVGVPPTQTLALDNACAATLPDYRSLATVTDDVSPAEAITFTQSPAPGTAVAGTGPVAVSFTATDESGKTTTASFTVTPQDVTPPVVLTRNLTRALQNGAVTITAADIDNGSSDPCGLDLSTLTVSPASFACSNIGVNTVTLSVRDESGNLASATATVTVTGVVPQVAVAPSRTNGTYTGLPANVIALGYGAQELTLTATDGTSAGSTFAWSPAAGLSTTSAAVTRFTPTAAGLYTFTVQATNPNGCSGTASVTVRVIDVRCGDLNNKVLVCGRTGAKPTQVCVEPDAVAALLAKWGTLDGCRPAAASAVAQGRAGDGGAAGAAVLTAAPNPFVREVTVRFRLPVAESHAVLDVYDGQGRQVGRLYEGTVEAGKEYRFAVAADRLPGRFFVARLVTPGQVYHYKLVRME
ncbi:MAG TPA: family 10 glycosylhydrolase, partial [Cytophagales bacterium]